MQATRPAVHQPTTTRTRPAGFLAAVLAAAGLAAFLAPDWTVTPTMPHESHLMALAAGSNPGYPWTFLGAMGGMVIAYGLILPAAFGVRGFTPAHAQAGTLALAAVTAVFAAYLLRRLVPVVGADPRGLLDVLSVAFYLLTPLPLLAAAWQILQTGELLAKRVLAGAVLLHAGMLGAMAATNIVGGPVAVLPLVRWG